MTRETAGSSGALKLVSLDEAGHDGFERARREARILAKAEHPALVACHGMFEDPRRGLLGLVMDFVDGGTLAAAIQADRLDDERAAAVLREIAEALEYIHRVGLVHRDLKPENVLLTEAFWEDPEAPGGVKLVDFGIATTAQRKTRVTALGRIVGTPAYLAPEVLDPDFFGPDQGTARDVFAFGVLGYLLRCHRHPSGLGFEASTGEYAHTYRESANGRRGWPPREVIGTGLAACLALRPEGRPREAAAMLEESSATDVALAEEDGAGEQARRSFVPTLVVTEVMPGPPAILTAAGPARPMVPPLPVAPKNGTVRSALVLGAAAGVVMIGGALAGSHFAEQKEAEHAVTATTVSSASAVSDAPSAPAPPHPQLAPSLNGPSLGRFHECFNESEETIYRGAAFAIRARGLLPFECHACAANEKQALGAGRWAMWLGRVKPKQPGSPKLLDSVCAHVPGSEERQVCRGPDSLRQPGPLIVTVEDLTQGRVAFTLFAASPESPEGKRLAPVRGRIGPILYSTALCEGAVVRLDALEDDLPGGAAVTVYLLEPG